MKTYFFTIICFGFFSLSSCTYSINMIHSEGESTDAVSETQSATPDIKPSLTIPATALGV